MAKPSTSVTDQIVKSKKELAQEKELKNFTEYCNELLTQIMVKNTKAAMNALICTGYDLKDIPRNYFTNAWIKVDLLEFINPLQDKANNTKDASEKLEKEKHLAEMIQMIQKTPMFKLLSEAVRDENDRLNIFKQGIDDLGSEVPNAIIEYVFNFIREEVEHQLYRNMKNAYRDEAEVSFEIIPSSLSIEGTQIAIDLDVTHSIPRNSHDTSIFKHFLHLLETNRIKNVGIDLSMFFDFLVWQGLNTPVILTKGNFLRIFLARRFYHFNAGKINENIGLYSIVPNRDSKEEQDIQFWSEIDSNVDKLHNNQSIAGTDSMAEVPVHRANRSIEDIIHALESRRFHVKYMIELYNFYNDIDAIAKSQQTINVKEKIEILNFATNKVFPTELINKVLEYTVLEYPIPDPTKAYPIQHVMLHQFEFLKRPPSVKNDETDNPLADVDGNQYSLDVVTNHISNARTLEIRGTTEIRSEQSGCILM